MRKVRKSYGHVIHSKIYPVIDSKRSQNKTIAIIVNEKQATDLARFLLNASCSGGKIAITGFRKNGHVTVTTT